MLGLISKLAPLPQLPSELWMYIHALATAEMSPLTDSTNGSLYQHGLAMQRFLRVCVLVYSMYQLC
jgi:hypothetical protein